MAQILGLFSIFSLLSMAGHFFKFWWFPEWGGQGDEYKFVLTVMLCEAFLLFTNMAPLAMASAEKGLGRYLLLGFILLMALVCGGLLLASFEAPLTASINYVMAVIVRGLNAYAFAGRDGEDPHPYAVARFGAGIYLFILCVFASVFFPFPEGTLESLDVPGRGIWQRAPTQLVGAATVYFFCQAYFEFCLWLDARRPHPAGKKQFAAIKKVLPFKGKKTGGQQAGQANRSGIGVADVEAMGLRLEVAAANVVLLGLALFMLLYAPAMTPFLLMGVVFTGPFTGSGVLFMISMGVFVIGFFGTIGFFILTEIFGFF